MNCARCRRKTEIIAHVVKGKSNFDVALEMKLTEKTVKWHLTDIYKHFGVKNRHELRAMFGGVK